ncbi:MAG: VOC family protein [Flavobacteriales bacterium]|jgi:predicted enzyme related to lactoylglutathione lyase|nr:VOC family protein [Flavobacteriales bacterium]
MNNTLINYIEFKSTDLEATRQFYSQLFGWEFKAYGDRYIAFSGAGIDGGFELTDEEIQNGVLVVLYHRNLEEILGKLKQLKTVITRPIFSFPGGRRLQFLDPSGNELAIWSE